MFEQLVSPEQKQLSATVAAKGGVKALRNNDKILLELDRKVSGAPGAPGTEGHRAPPSNVGRSKPGRSKPSDTNQNADDLRAKIFEDPDAAVEKNQTVYFRKFEAQKRQIIDELTLVVKRQSDRVIREIKAGPHERILDCVRALHT
jgi:hypothetical protein